MRGGDTEGEGRAHCCTILHAGPMQPLCTTCETWKCLVSDSPGTLAMQVQMLDQDHLLLALGPQDAAGARGIDIPSSGYIMATYCISAGQVSACPSCHAVPCDGSVLYILAVEPGGLASGFRHMLLLINESINESFDLLAVHTMSMLPWHTAPLSDALCSEEMGQACKLQYTCVVNCEC